MSKLRELTHSNLRGMHENHKQYPTIRCCLFSSNMTARVGIMKTTFGHAMLTVPQPGDYLPNGCEKHVPVELSHVHMSSQYRGRGHATALVKDCLNYAQRRRWSVFLRVTPYGRGAARHAPLTESMLLSWYAHLGLKVLEKADGVWYMGVDYRR